mmetsp:Transcript_59738/g.144312  ORF Transcript_59738/g.144312 Transcript_59738/m.144312 type:complete len:229 (-) Transcript_59738:289-975(-)
MAHSRRARRSEGHRRKVEVNLPQSLPRPLERHLHVPPAGRAVVQGRQGPAEFLLKLDLPLCKQLELVDLPLELSLALGELLVVEPGILRRLAARKHRHSHFALRTLASLRILLVLERPLALGAVELHEANHRGHALEKLRRLLLLVLPRAVVLVQAQLEQLLGGHRPLRVWEAVLQRLGHDPLVGPSLEVVHQDRQYHIIDVVEEAPNCFAGLKRTCHLAVAVNNDGQ